MTRKQVEDAYRSCEMYRETGERPATGHESRGYGDVLWTARYGAGLCAVLARIELAWRGQLSR